MLQKTVQTAFGLLLLGLMILVPTDLLRIGLSNLSNGEYMAITMEIEMESDIDSEEKEESKEKHKKKNKITVHALRVVLGLQSINALGSHTNKATFGRPLAHYLEVWTPPPELV